MMIRMLWISICTITLSLFSCDGGGASTDGQAQVEVEDKDGENEGGDSADVSVASIEFSGNQVNISGQKLDQVTALSFQNGDETTELTISEKSAESLIASFSTALNVAIDKASKVIFKVAEASTTVDVTFTLSDGSVAASALGQSSAENGQVLSWDGDKWAPTTVATAPSCDAEFAPIYNASGQLICSLNTSINNGRAVGIGNSIPTEIGNTADSLWESVYIGWRAGMTKVKTQSVAIGARASQEGPPLSVNIGYSAGRLDIGGSNVMIGYNAGAAVTNAQNNVIIGHNAASTMATTSDDGQSNVLIGGSIATAGELGDSNVGVGFQVFQSTMENTAVNNTALGHRSMRGLTSGTHNTAVGQQSGQNITTGDENTLVGVNAGSGLSTGSGNIIIGRTANAATANGDNQLAIGNSTGNIIEGDIAGKKVTIHDVLRIEPRTSAPTCAAGNQGEVYTDDSGALCFCDGTSWSVAAGGGSCT